MIPLVGTARELERQKALVVDVARKVREETGVEVPYQVGVMIEVPRAALTADEIAREAEYFSFGTNDLTQLTFGYSRDDAGKFLHTYLEQRILPQDPFVSLDRSGVGELMRIAAEKGRATRPELKLGICGEHGGDPASIALCEELGLAYVSCSPYRVPIARLAAAQVALRARASASSRAPAGRGPPSGAFRRADRREERAPFGVARGESGSYTPRPSMRPPFALVALFALSACAPDVVERIPPSNQLYFPTGLAYVDGPGPEGTLFVASSNADRRYDEGSLDAIDLSALALPAFGSAPAQIDTFGLKQAGENRALVRSFAGRLGTFALPDGRTRVFVPSRAEGSLINVVDAQGLALSCGDAGTRCVDAGPSVENVPNQVDAIPGIHQPPAVVVGTRAPFAGRVFATQLAPTASPPSSQTNFFTYLVSFDAADPVVTTESFVDVQGGSTDALALGQRWVYVGGRGASTSETALRVVDPLTGKVLFPTIALRYPASDIRGLALNAAETRLYLVARQPEPTLVVIDLGAPTSNTPTFNVVRTVPLPPGPTQAKLLERPGRGDLLAISCGFARSLVFYDDDRGALVSTVEDLGTEPYDLAVSPRGAGARLFVSNFEDGQVAVVDLPDLAHPAAARKVALIGKPQLCIARPDDANCEGVK